MDACGRGAGGRGAFRLVARRRRDGVPQGPWRTVLAGGVSAANVAAALSLRPDVIDVSGSLETSPGRKDVSLLDEFVRAFRTIAMRLVSDGAE